jgi:hypothetical protein
LGPCLLAALLELLVRCARDTPVRNRGGEHGDVSGQRRTHGLQHLGRGLDLDHVDTCKRRRADRSGHERDTGAEPRSLGGDGRSLLAGGPVRDIAHGIDRLVRRTAGDKHMPAGKGAFAGWPPGRDAQQGLDRLDQLRHLGQSSGAGLAALCHLARLGADEVDAVRPQLCHVAARGGLRPHVRVHRGGGQHRLVCREQQRGCEVVGVAARHLGEEVGGGWGDHDQVGVARQADVADLALGIEVEQLR